MGSAGEDLTCRARARRWRGRSLIWCGAGWSREGDAFLTLWLVSVVVVVLWWWGGFIFSREQERAGNLTGTIE